MSDLFIPPKTAEKLATEQGPGNRHHAAMQIAISLIGNGFAPAAVFSQLRAKFPPEKTDKELQDIVNYAVGVHPKPSGDPNFTPTPRQFIQRAYAPPPPPKPKPPAEHAAWWLNGYSITMEEFCGKSQVPVPASKKDALVAMLELVYNGPDNLNMVCIFTVNQAGKACPTGHGQTLTRDKWVEWVNAKGVPQRDAGAWFRPNPVKPVGSGAGGAVTDSDVVKFRFMLLESDVLSIEQQLALFARIRLPITVALLSGGNSAHAWVNISAKTAEEYEQRTRRILTALAPFGVDQANKNPSRLSRLPGAIRNIGGVNGGEQKLLWLNPGKPDLAEKDLAEFEESLLVPSVEEKPFARLVSEAVDRYEQMVLNKGKLGVPTGIVSFDRVSGGLKPGGYTLIGAATGAGKTTLALNMINAALKVPTGVALFSLEMTREDIVDMMFCLNCRVDRNCFNTGEFTEQHLRDMGVGAAWMKNLPLWVDDKPDLTVDEIRKRVLALRREANIGLVVVDYAQLAMTDTRVDIREQAVAAVALGMRLLSREANVPLILLSQLNDQGQMRESRKLNHEATTVMFLERDSGELDDPNMTLRIGKGRKIPATPIKLFIKPEWCLITERGPIDQNDIPRKHHPTHNDP